MSKLILEKNGNEFFVAICKEDVHSFLVFGVYNQVENKSYLLAKFGKQLNINNKSQTICSEWFNMLFADMKAQLVSEMVINEDKHREYASSKDEINYKAFNITLAQYHSFIAILMNSKMFTRHPGLCAYLLSDETESFYEFSFQKTCISYSDSNVKFDVDEHVSASSIHVSDTCRHTALSLLEMVFAGRLYDADVISNYASYTKNFPYRSNIIREYSVSPTRKNLIEVSLDKNLLIFPLPPSPYLKNNQVNMVLHMLYKQLNRIASKYLENDVTYKKFAAVKQLYKTLYAKQNQSIDEVFTSIDEWVEVHASLIDHQRGFSFFRPTATRAMINLLKQMQENQNNAKPAPDIAVSM